MGLPTSLHGKSIRTPSAGQKICPSCHRAISNLKVVTDGKALIIRTLCPYCSYEFSRTKISSRPDIELIEETKVFVMGDFQDFNEKAPVLLVEKLKELIGVSTTPNPEIDDSTIVGVMINKRDKAYAKSYIYFLAALIAHLLFVAITRSPVNYWLVLLIILAGGILFVNRALLEYRVRKGYYGSNEDEAREIIQFVLEHADKTDFTDGSGMKKLMPDPEIELQDVIIPERGLTV